MKKTYKKPAMLAVTMLHENSILTYSFDGVETGDPGITGPGQDDPSTGGGDVKRHSIWDDEW